MKIGIIGCGHISTTHLHGWSKIKSATVSMVFDLNSALAQGQARKFSVPTVASSLEQIIESCDVLDVCTPPASHAKIALSVVEAGKHLLIEKPIVIDPADWDLIKKVAISNRSKVAVVHHMKFSDTVRRAKRLLDEGRIGRLIRIEKQFLTHPERDRMLTADRHWSHSLPGGRWFETLPHDLYLAHHFMGNAELDHVTALRTDSAPDGASADEVTLNFKNTSAIALMQYSANCRQNVRSMTLRGTEGFMQLDLLGDSLFVSRLPERVRTRPIGFENITRMQALIWFIPDRLRYLWTRLKQDTPHSRIIRQFSDSIRGLAKEPTPLDEVDFVVRNCNLVGQKIDDAVGKRAASTDE